MLHQQLEEKNKYLKVAYEEAYKYAPDSPLSVNINPRALGKHIGFDEATTSRIVRELVADGYAESSLGMGNLMITMGGLNYLRKIETPSNDNSIINLNIGNNSNVQFQHRNITLLSHFRLKTTFQFPFFVSTCFSA